MSHLADGWTCAPFISRSPENSYEPSREPLGPAWPPMARQHQETERPTRSHLGEFRGMRRSSAKRSRSLTSGSFSRAYARHWSPFWSGGPGSSALTQASGWAWTPRSSLSPTQSASRSGTSSGASPPVPSRRLGAGGCCTRSRGSWNSTGEMAGAGSMLRRTRSRSTGASKSSSRRLTRMSKAWCRRAPAAST